MKSASLLFSGTLLQCIVLSILTSATANGQSLLPLLPGMGVVTCGSSNFVDTGRNDPGFVVGVMDLRNPPLSVKGVNWAPPAYHGPNDSWTDDNLGQVFGICLDDVQNIYVTATSSYGRKSNGARMTGPGGPGGVYKLNGITGVIEVFASLPNTGPGLGNICFDKAHNQFYVTNFEDGKIYRLSRSGAILETFDPYQPDDGKDGFAELGERPWGIGYYSGRVYYGIWWEDLRRWNQPDRKNEIRSIGVNSSGAFLNDDRHEFELKELLSNSLNGVRTSPVADIAFSTNGRMMLAERTMLGDMQPHAHQSRVMEYEHFTGSWTYSQTFQIGVYSATDLDKHYNAAGGVDFGYDGFDEEAGKATGLDEAIWASGDALRFRGLNPDNGTDFVYGITRIPSSGNTPQNVGTDSYFVDLDNDLVNQYKTQLGDVEIYRTICQLPGITISVNKYAAQIYPAIITDHATITVSLAFDGPLRIEAFNAAGVSIGSIVNGAAAAGEQYIRWETSHLDPGLYFVRMQSDGWVRTAQVMIVR